MNDPAHSASVVLIGRYPGKDLAVAQALAALVGREDTWGLRVVSASPIVVFEKLSRQEAAYIVSLLTPAAEAGCRFEIQDGSNAAYPKVGWAVPPKFNSVPLAQICAEAARMPPLPAAAPAPPDNSGATMRGTARIPLPHLNTLNAAQNPTPTHPQVPIHPAHTYATLYLPCPYTGQTMKLTLDVTVSRVENAGNVSLAAQATVAPVALRPSQSGTIVLPTARRGTVSGAIPVALLETARSAPLDSSVSSAVAPTVARPNSSSHSLPAPSWRRKTPPDGLPDVPVLPSTNFAGPSRVNSEAASHLPSGGQPMDLSDFEHSLGLETGAEPELVENSPSAIFGDPKSSGELDAMLADGGGRETLCSIFIERSSSPVVHELVAELHGIPEPEAAQLCVSGRTALAENIPLEEAVEIKRRCAEINVMARIVTHR